MKKESGITLVALVVTIIVLLILAGVTISLALSNRGIIDRAKSAGTTWNQGVTNETNAMLEGEETVNTIYRDYVNH